MLEKDGIGGNSVGYLPILRYWYEAYTRIDRIL